MKKTIFLFFLILSITGLTKAQEYIPLAVDNAQWIVSFDDNSTIPPVDGLWEYRAIGDTLLDDLSYIKIYKRNLVVDLNSNFTPPFTPDGEYNLYALIRDDVENRKVYAIKYDDYGNCPNNVEYLLYDFSINIGDFIDFCLVPEDFEYEITDIYDQEVLGFDSRKYEINQWHFLYEGMGSEFGLFEELFEPAKYTQRTFLYYYCRGDEDCGLTVGVSEFTNNNYQFELFPSPADDFITIKYEGQLSASALGISILNTHGQTVVSKKLSSEKINSVDVSKLPNGIYIVCLLEKGNIVTKKKLVISH